MATIKSFSDLQQSKKLAEILPLESADMTYYACVKDWKGNPVPPKWNKPVALTKEELALPRSNFQEYKYIPCWSLAALLGVLPNKIVSHETAFEGEDAEGINDIYYKRIESTEDGRYMCCYSGNGYKYKYVADNPIDACYELIVKLNELNLL